MDELKEVLFRSKFDRYVGREERTLFLGRLGSIAEIVPIIQLVRACRDPKDDKFLEVALNGRADAIVTGDADLLRMHPWREIAIFVAGSVPAALASVTRQTDPSIMGITRRASL